MPSASAGSATAPQGSGYATGQTCWPIPGVQWPSGTRCSRRRRWTPLWRPPSVKQPRTQKYTPSSAWEGYSFIWNPTPIGFIKWLLTWKVISNVLHFHTIIHFVIFHLGLWLRVCFFIVLNIYHSNVYKNVHSHLYKPESSEMFWTLANAYAYFIHLGDLQNHLRKEY